MKATQIQYSFIEEVAKIRGKANIPSDTIFYWFNKGQQAFLETRYGKNNIYNKGFEEIQKRIDDIRSLLLTTTLDTTVINNTKVTSTLPEDYNHFIKMSVTIQKSNCPDSIIYPTFVEHDDIAKVSSDPFNKPDGMNVNFNFEGDTLVFYKIPSVTLYKPNLTYIKNPKFVTINNTENEKQFEENEYVNEPEFPESTHREILDIAVRMFLGAEGDGRYNMKLNETKLQE